MVKYLVMDKKLTLSKKDKAYIEAFKRNGRHSLREFNRATILIFLDKGLSVSDIEDLLNIDRTTIWRVKSRFFERGIEYALVDNQRSGQPKKYNTDQESELVAMACGPAPEGRRRWTVRLLVEELRKVKGFETITFGTVRSILKKTNLSLG